jgi:hypothetical protein
VRCVQYDQLFRIGGVKSDVLAGNRGSAERTGRMGSVGPAALPRLVVYAEMVGEMWWIVNGFDMQGSREEDRRQKTADESTSREVGNASRCAEANETRRVG